MNGADIKKAAINKAKQVAQGVGVQAANSNGNKKRRKGGDLKPIITTGDPNSEEGSPASSVKSHKSKYVLRLVAFSQPAP
jgi:serine/threonine-protein kinase SRPK3